MPMLFVSPYMEKFVRNVEQSRAKRLVSRHSPPSTSQRRKSRKKEEKKKIERRKIEKKRCLLSSGISNISRGTQRILFRLKI